VNELGTQLGLLADAMGFRQVAIDHWPPAGTGLRPLPSCGDPTVDGLVEALNGDLLLIDRALFGPRLVRVVARR
jgi:hypothetical protein